MKPITEDDKDVINQWFDDARKQTISTIDAFIKSLALDYQHDYGTICRAIAAAAIGAMAAVDSGPQGGITGFQAGCIQWEIINRYGALGTKDSPKRLVDYSTMLYPQYERQFRKTITADTWRYLQKRAAELLKTSPHAHEDVLAHWQLIVSGVVPFDYRVTEEKES